MISAYFTFRNSKNIRFINKKQAKDFFVKEFLRSLGLKSLLSKFSILINILF